MPENILGGRIWQFFLKDQIVNILGLAGHMISIATTKGNRCRTKAAINNSKQTDRPAFQENYTETAISLD